MSRSAPIDLTVDSSPEVTPARLPLPPRNPAPLPPPQEREAGTVLGGAPSSSPHRRLERRQDLFGAPPDRVARARERNEADFITISDDSDDDDQAGPSGRRRRRRPLLPEQEFRAHMQALDASLDRHGAEINRIREQELEALRAAEAPARPGPANVRIALGGAVFRNGTREVRFAPGQPAQHFRVEIVGQIAEPQPVEPPARRQPRRGVRMNGVLPRFLGGGGGDIEDEDEEDNAGGPGPASAAVHRMLGGLGIAIQGFHRMDLLNRGGIFVGGPSAAAANDPKAIVAKVTLPTLPPARQGYTNTWDMDEIESGGTIELDDNGKVVKPKNKSYLACANCPEPLRISGAARDNDDRVWALRCGHLLDERCTKALSTGDDPDLAEPSPKKRKTRRGKPKVVEHSWDCPTCSRTHVSQLLDGEWKQKEGYGATLLFV